MMQPFVTHHLARPGELQDVETFVEARGAHLTVRIVRADPGASAIPGSAKPDWKHESTVRQIVYGEGLAGDLPRPAARQREHHRTQRDAFGDERHATEHDPRIEHVAWTDRDIVPHEVHPIRELPLPVPW